MANFQLLQKAHFILQQQNTNLETLFTLSVDLESLKLLLQLYQYNIQQGVKLKTNFPLIKVLSYLNSDNTNEICDVLKIAADIYTDNDSFTKELIKEFYKQNGNRLTQLRILNVILNSCTYDNLLSNDVTISYFKKLLSWHSDCNVDEWKYFMINIIPAHIKTFPKEDVVNAVWLEAEKSGELQLLCVLNEHLDTLLPSTSYWKLIQDTLSSNDALKFKPATYLLRSSLELLKSYARFKSDNAEIEYSEDTKPEFFKSMDWLCLLLDVSQDKQLHLVEPSLHFLKRLSTLHSSWLRLIFGIFLRHPHNSVVYMTVNILFTTDGVVCNNEDLITALNKSECTQLTKQVFRYFNLYLEKLDESKYEELLKSSLKIVWIPVAFWMFFKNCKTFSIEILKEIIKKCKKLPHRYIRRGCFDLVYTHVANILKHTEIPLLELSEVLIEFLNDDNLIFYATRLINLKNLKVDANCLKVMTSWLNDEHPNAHKIDLIAQVVNRKSIPFEWIRDNVQIPFKKRAYKYLTLDRLTHSYCIRVCELEQYLIQRLDVAEESHKICHLDKAHNTLINKSCAILNADASYWQKHLAFEILFYLNDCRFSFMCKNYLKTMLNRQEKVPSGIAMGLINLLSKISAQQMHNEGITIKDLINLYETCFNTQPDEISVRIFKNIDVILENSDCVDFINACFTQLNNMRRSEYFETAVRNFIRSIALSHQKIDGSLLDYVLEELFTFSRSSDVVTYYLVLYFKSIPVNVEKFPIYVNVLYGNVYSKEQSAEYEICRDIFLNSHIINPCFRTAEIHKWSVENILSDVNPKRINKIVTYLINEYKIHSKRRYFPDSAIHLQKLRIAQTFAFIIPYVTGDTKNELKELLVGSFCDESHQSSVRQLMQYTLIQLLKDESNCLEYISKTIDKTGKMHTSTITGFIPVLYGLELMKNNLEFSMGAIETMLPWTMGAHFKLRLYSQFAICRICEKNATNRKFKQKFDGVHRAVEQVLAATTAIDDSLHHDFNLIKYIHVEEPHADARKLIYLISVYIPETTNVIPSEWEYFKIKNSWSRYCKENQNKTKEDQLVQETEIAFTNVQKKITPWQEFFDVPKPAHQLIVVTTLIDSAANLGGLSRTCEIFKVSQMVVNNSRVVNDREFQNLSMSSEKLINITEVKVAELKEYIMKCKEKGYKCIGAEQTAESVCMSSYKFEEKTVLILGNERSGIPSHLIPYLDVCIEIPQFGMIRSLNVHVAGALLIWEYTKQVALKPKSA